VANDKGRSGKSSISKVVFHKLPPSETLYLETTYRIKKESMQYVASLRATLTN
jgi:Ras-related GTP-binding protein C/D